MKEDILDENENPEAHLKGNFLKNKKLIIIIIIALAAIGGGAGYFLYSKQAIAKSSEEKHQEQLKETPKDFYIDLDKILVNLSTTSGAAASFLDISLSIEVGSQEAIDKIKAQLPKVKDNFQTYLRELRPDDLQGSTGTMRLKEDLQSRLTKLLYPIDVKEILVREIIVQ